MYHIYIYIYIGGDSEDDRAPFYLVVVITSVNLSVNNFFSFTRHTPLMLVVHFTFWHKKVFYFTSEFHIVKHYFIHCTSKLCHSLHPDVLYTSISQFPKRLLQGQHTLLWIQACSSQILLRMGGGVTMALR